MTETPIATRPTRESRDNPRSAATDTNSVRVSTRAWARATQESTAGPPAAGSGGTTPRKSTT